MHTQTHVCSFTSSTHLPITRCDRQGHVCDRKHRTHTHSKKLSYHWAISQTPLTHDRYVFFLFGGRILSPHVSGHFVYLCDTLITHTHDARTPHTVTRRSQTRPNCIVDGVLECRRHDTSVSPSTHTSALAFWVRGTPGCEQNTQPNNQTHEGIDI